MEPCPLPSRAVNALARIATGIMVLAGLIVAGLLPGPIGRRIVDVLLRAWGRQ